MIVDQAADNDKVEQQRSNIINGQKGRETGNEGPLQEKKRTPEPVKKRDKIGVEMVGASSGRYSTTSMKGNARNGGRDRAGRGSRGYGGQRKKERSNNKD